MNPEVATTSANDHSLSRSLRPRHVTMITIGGIIGAGLFVGSSAAIAEAGPAVIISYALTGMMVLMVMRMLGEMAVAMPEVRSFTEFARAGLGNWAGFVVGWLYWYFWVIVIPVEAIAGAAILQRWIPQVPMLALGTGLMAVMTAVNMMSARAFGEFEFWFSSIKVSAILVFIFFTAAYAFGLIGPGTPVLANLTAHGGFMPFGPKAVLAAVTTVFFSMMGAEIVTVAAAESPDPAKGVARMVSTVVWRILGFYIISLLLIVCVIPWDSIKSGYSPFTAALDGMHVQLASLIMSAIILTAVLSCLNSSFYVVSRVLFVLAGRGDAPRWLVKTNSRHVPARSVLLGSAAGFLGILAREWAPDTVFKFLVNASGALIIFIYMAIAVAQVRLRKQRERNGVASAGLDMWLFPWASYAAIAGMGAVLIAMAASPAMQSELWVSLLSVAVALLAYYLLRGRRP
jgi:AAT family amino acid transporter/GABA permease